MTQEDKELLIGRMLEQPDSLSDKEAEAIARDTELRELYDTAVLLKTAAQATQQCDIDKEWEKFKAKNTHKFHFGRKWAATAAILLSLGAVATTITYHVISTERHTAQTEATKPQAAKQPRHIQSAPQEEIRLDHDITFENATLSEIAEKTAVAFACKVNIADTALEDLRLYMTLGKGSTAADFVALVDAYNMLHATMSRGTITIRKQEVKQ